MGGPCDKLEKQHSLIFNGQRSAADCTAQQSADSPENLINYAPHLPNCNWPLHWSMTAHLSLKERALIFSSPPAFWSLKNQAAADPFSQECLLLCQVKKTPFLFFLPLFVTSAPLQFISSLPLFFLLLAGCRASQTWF